MAKIFISYRRADSAAITDSVRDHLMPYFGKENIFLDVESIPAGTYFEQYLDEQIAAHDVVLVIIGQHWEQLMIDRVGDNKDFVRFEIESALRLNKGIIPVLVEDAKQPDFSQLPESISQLQRLQWAKVRRIPDLETDCTRLVNAIYGLLKITPPSPVDEREVKEALSVLSELGTVLADFMPIGIQIEAHLSDAIQSMIRTEGNPTDMWQFMTAHANDSLPASLKNDMESFTGNVNKCADALLEISRNELARSLFEYTNKLKGPGYLSRIAETLASHGYSESERTLELTTLRQLFTLAAGRLQSFTYEPIFFSKSNTIWFKEKTPSMESLFFVGNLIFFVSDPKRNVSIAWGLAILCELYGSIPSSEIVRQYLTETNHMQPSDAHRNLIEPDRIVGTTFLSAINGFEKSGMEFVFGW